MSSLAPPFPAAGQCTGGSKDARGLLRRWRLAFAFSALLSIATPAHTSPIGIHAEIDHDQFSVGAVPEQARDKQTTRSPRAGTARLERAIAEFLPRDVFFSDYFLFSAQEDVVSMSDTERIALLSLVETCAGALRKDDTARLRCDLSRLDYLARYRQNRMLDRLLDAVQFMTALVQYNRTIGRQSEAGLDSRFGEIQTGLIDALRLGEATTAAAQSLRRTNDNQ